MNIPRTFNLAGRTWHVKHVTEEVAKKANPAVDDCHGFADDENAIIYLIKGNTKEYTEITFLHELTHALLFARGYRDHDETEVEGLAQLFYQYFLTRKGVINLD